MRQASGRLCPNGISERPSMTFTLGKMSRSAHTASTRRSSSHVTAQGNGFVGPPSLSRSATGFAVSDQWALWGLWRHPRRPRRQRQIRERAAQCRGRAGGPRRCRLSALEAPRRRAPVRARTARRVGRRTPRSRRRRDATWASLASPMRTKIRRAQKAGFTVETSRDIAGFYDVLSRTCSERARPFMVGASSRRSSTS